MGRPMAVAERDCTGPQGQLKGTIRLEPNEVDRIVQRAYGHTYDGNTKDRDKLAQDYMDEYSAYIYRDKPWRVEPLTGQDLREGAERARDTATGPDEWYPADFKMLSDLSFLWLAELLNLVEQGSGWPKQMTQARAVYMPKDADKERDPLAYRVVLILPAVYRLWARVRLAHITPRVDGWDLDCIYAGTSVMGCWGRFVRHSHIP